MFGSNVKQAVDAADLFKTVPSVSLRARQAQESLHQISELNARRNVPIAESARWDEFRKDFDDFMLDFHREVSSLLTLFRDFSDNYSAFLRSGSASFSEKHVRLTKFLTTLETERSREQKTSDLEASRGRLEVYIDSLRQLTRERREAQLNPIQGTVLIMLYIVVKLVAGPFFAVGFPIYDILEWLTNQQQSIRQQQTDREYLYSQEEKLAFIKRLLSTLKDCEPAKFLVAFTTLIKNLDVVMSAENKDEDADFLKTLDVVDSEVTKLTGLLVTLQQQVSP